MIGARLDEQTNLLYRTLTDLLKAHQFRERKQTCAAGITSSECYALEAIADKSPLSVTGLGKLLGLNKSSASRICRSLQRKKLILLSSHPTDERSIEARVTERGSAHLEAIRRAAKDEYRGVLKSLNPDERASFLKGMGLLNEGASRRKARG
jgi:MarR family 2-MHQ and catechol resistance regulon transcriptional repressor